VRRTKAWGGKGMMAAIDAFKGGVAAEETRGAAQARPCKGRRGAIGDGAWSVAT
jgi:hypothetical protein